MSSFLRWKTRDGRVVAVRDMDDSHLLNAFAYARDKFKEETGINWFPGISGYRNTGRNMAPFLLEFYSEAMRRKLEWNRGVADADPMGLLDDIFVSASAARKPRPVIDVAQLGKKFSIKLGDD